MDRFLNGIIFQKVTGILFVIGVVFEEVILIVIVNYYKKVVEHL